MSTGRFTRKMRDGDAMEFSTVPGFGIEVTVNMDTQEVFVSGAFDVDARECREVEGGWEVPLRKYDWLRVWPGDSESETPILVETKRHGAKVSVTISDPLCRRVSTTVAEEADDAPEGD